MVNDDQLSINYKIQHASGKKNVEWKKKFTYVRFLNEQGFSIHSKHFYVSLIIFHLVDEFGFLGLNVDVVDDDS